MKINTTIDELIAAFGPEIRRFPSNKPRDPVERDLLKRLGDPGVSRESTLRTRKAGERLRPSNSGVDPVE